MMLCWDGRRCLAVETSKASSLPSLGVDGQCVTTRLSWCTRVVENQVSRVT